MAQRPVALRQQWDEYPSPAFIACLAFIAIGLASFVLGITGVIGTSSHRPLTLAADLVGSTADVTRSLLGNPSMVRHEPPAEVWQYRSDDCVLDVYVYDTVRHAEVRERHPGTDLDAEALDRSCLKDLRLAAAH